MMTNEEKKRRMESSVDLLARAIFQIEAAWRAETTELHRMTEDERQDECFRSDIILHLYRAKARAWQAVSHANNALDLHINNRPEEEALQ